MYKLEENGIIKLPEMMFIPIDPGNRHYQEYLQWVNQGNIPIGQDVPIEAIDLTTLTVDDVKLFNIKKDQKLSKLDETTTNYIHQNYSDQKQKSDIADKEYYSNYLISYGVDEITFRTEVKTSVLNIFDTDALFTDEVNRLLTLFPAPVDANNNPIADPNIWNTAIDQLLKVAVRVEFIIRVKQEYKTLKDTINAATTITDLDSIVISFNTTMPQI